MLEAALDRYEGPLLRYAASVVGRAAAPDVVQDTFRSAGVVGRTFIASADLELVQALRTFAPGDHSAWLTCLPTVACIQQPGRINFEQLVAGPIRCIDATSTHPANQVRTRGGNSEP